MLAAIIKGSCSAYAIEREGFLKNSPSKKGISPINVYRNEVFPEPTFLIIA